MELCSCLKDGRRQWNKMVNMLFNKVLGEMKNISFNFYLRTKGTFWLTKNFTIKIYLLSFSLSLFLLDPDLEQRMQQSLLSHQA